MKEILESLLLWFSSFYACMRCLYKITEEELWKADPESPDFMTFIWHIRNSKAWYSWLFLIIFLFILTFEASFLLI